MRNAFVAILLSCAAALAADPPAITITTPMPPPNWAMLERELLKHNSAACDRFAAKYLDERGYLESVLRRRLIPFYLSDEFREALAGH